MVYSGETKIIMIGGGSVSSKHTGYHSWRDLYNFPQMKAMPSEVDFVIFFESMADIVEDEHRWRFRTEADSLGVSLEVVFDFGCPSLDINVVVDKKVVSKYFSEGLREIEIYNSKDLSYLNCFLGLGKIKTAVEVRIKPNHQVVCSSLNGEDDG